MILKLTKSIRKSPIKEATFQLRLEWLADSGEVPAAFSMKWVLELKLFAVASWSMSLLFCCKSTCKCLPCIQGQLLHNAEAAFTWCGSSGCSSLRVWYERDLLSCAAWRYLPLWSLLWPCFEAHFPLLPLLLSKYCPSSGRPQLGAFYSFASVKTKVEEGYRSLCDKHGFCHELENVYKSKIKVIL